MEKIMTIVVSIALTLTCGAAALTANPTATTTTGTDLERSATVQPLSFGSPDDGALVDTEGNGVCNNGDHCQFPDVNEDGICDAQGEYCANFQDTDHDGICDNCQNLNLHCAIQEHENNCSSNGSHDYCGSEHDNAQADRSAAANYDSNRHHSRHHSSNHH